MSSKNASYPKVTNLAISISCSQAIGVSIVTTLPLDKKTTKLRLVGRVDHHFQITLDHDHQVFYD
jgi:hypothetical protein